MNVSLSEFVIVTDAPLAARISFVKKSLVKLSFITCSAPVVPFCHLIIPSITNFGSALFKSTSITSSQLDVKIKYMMENKGIVLDRVTILDEVWGMDVYVEERVVDTNIKVLRKKLGEYGANIKTVFGVGYKFDEEI